MSAFSDPCHYWPEMENYGIRQFSLLLKWGIRRGQKFMTVSVDFHIRYMVERNILCPHQFRISPPWTRQICYTLPKMVCIKLHHHRWKVKYRRLFTSNFLGKWSTKHAWIEIILNCIRHIDFFENRKRVRHLYQLEKTSKQHPSNLQNIHLMLVIWVFKQCVCQLDKYQICTTNMLNLFYRKIAKGQFRFSGHYRKEIDDYSWLTHQ